MNEFSEDFSGILSSDTEFKGRLVFAGRFRIDGVFQGEIFSKDILEIGPDAEVKGFVDTESVYIAGYFEGEIVAENRVEILEGGLVRGKITSPILKIRDGGAFDGKSSMEKTRH